MILSCAVAGEFRKVLSLPAALVALGIAVLGTIGLSLAVAVQETHLNLVAHATPAGVVFTAAPMGSVGAVILGVVVISSEYTANSPDAGGGRQIDTTLIAVPGRLAVLTAKTVVVSVLIAAAATVATAISLASVHGVLGGTGAQNQLRGVIARSAGVAVYWTLMALVALAVTVAARSGIVPLIWFIANSSVVSVSLLLSKVMPAARYLPDLAGMRLFADPSSLAVRDPLQPLTGGLVMAAWAIGLTALSAVVFVRRDA